MERIFTKSAPAAIGPYSQAIMSDGMLFLSGQIPVCPETGLMVEGGIKEQANRVFENIKAVLAAAGFSFENVVKTTCFLSDINDFSAFNAEYEKYFVSKPARTLVAVKDLPKGALVEVEAIAKIK